MFASLISRSFQLTRCFNFNYPHSAYFSGYSGVMRQLFEPCGYPFPCQRTPMAGPILYQDYSTFGSVQQGINPEISRFFAVRQTKLKPSPVLWEGLFYPRVCGEHAKRTQPHIGSSPPLCGEQFGFYVCPVCREYSIPF